MPSFDIVSEVDIQEARNAVDQASREIGTRFDFKGVNAQYELKDTNILLSSESDFQVKQMLDILQNKFIKRGLEVTAMDIGEIETNLSEARLTIGVIQGIDTELAKKIVKLIKGSKLKVQASIQGEKIRVTGKKRDDLQETIAFVKEQKLSIPLQFSNFRD